MCHGIDVEKAFVDIQIQLDKLGPISDEEFAYVSADRTSDLHFYCRKCVGSDGGHRRFAKMNAVDHFRRRHPDVWDPAWFVVNDCNAIRDMTGKPLVLTCALHRHVDAAAIGSTVDESDGDDDDDDDYDVTSPDGSCSDKPADQSYNDLVASFNKNSSNERVLIPTPGTPFDQVCLVPRSMAMRLSADGYLAILDSGLPQWSPYFPVDMQRAVLLQLLPGGAQKRLLERRFGMDPFEPKLAIDGNAAPVGTGDMDRLRTWRRSLAAVVTSQDAVHKETQNKKYMEDALLIEKYHTPAGLKAIAFSQYLDLMTIHEAVCKTQTHQLTDQVLFKATACVITALYTNAPPRCPMEWESLLKIVMDDFLAVEDVDWFAFHHGTYGNDGVWIHASNRRALVLYREIVDTTPTIRANIGPYGLCFFQKQNISVHSYLKCTSSTEKLEPPIRANVQRKVWAAWAKSHEKNDHKCEEGPHGLSADVARSVLEHMSDAAPTPEENAELSKRCFLSLMGEPMNFPTLSDWKECGRRLPDILASMPSNYDAEDNEEEDEGPGEFIDILAIVVAADTITKETAILDGSDRPPMEPAPLRLGAKSKSAPAAKGPAIDLSIFIKPGPAADKCAEGSRSSAIPDLRTFMKPGPAYSSAAQSANTENMIRPQYENQNKKDKNDTNDKHNKRDKKGNATKTVNESRAATDLRYKVKKNSKNSKSTPCLPGQLSPNDRHALGVYRGISRGICFLEMEKKFIVKRLRIVQQGRAAYVPCKAEIETIINDGTQLGVVTGPRPDPEKVRHFMRQFLKLTSQM